MNAKLVREGNAFYEIDDACMAKKRNNQKNPKNEFQKKRSDNLFSNGRMSKQ